MSRNDLILGAIAIAWILALLLTSLIPPLSGAEDEQTECRCIGGEK